MATHKRSSSISGLFPESPSKAYSGIYSLQTRQLSPKNADRKNIYKTGNRILELPEILQNLDISGSSHNKSRKSITAFKSQNRSSLVALDNMDFDPSIIHYDATPLISKEDSLDFPLQIPSKRLSLINNSIEQSPLKKDSNSDKLEKELDLMSKSILEIKSRVNILEANVEYYELVIQLYDNHKWEYEKNIETILKANDCLTVDLKLSTEKTKKLSQELDDIKEMLKKEQIEKEKMSNEIEKLKISQLIFVEELKKKYEIQRGFLEQKLCSYENKMNNEIEVMKTEMKMQIHLLEMKSLQAIKEHNYPISASFPSNSNPRQLNQYKRGHNHVLILSIFALLAIFLGSSFNKLYSYQQAIQ
ncbi:hypothetical protein SteCoe_8346 [Stentor coeruleus]|uniref:Uncharacterized protein n=1 Tax=Stentor coeruleus TaxID=5963 RepID=A0A1R2CKR9_9CILI|nr:hypothetical protein SteCoe_8346 [Stentor coeruleus]